MSIGEALRGARIAAGLTVDRVSEATRVRQTIIEAIERDDFSGCGGDFYARGHIRNIAAVVGVDPAPLLAEFDASHDDAGARSLESLQSETYTIRRRGGPNWSAAMAVVLMLVLTFGVVRLVTGDDEGSPPVAAGKPSATSTPRSSATPSEEPPVASVPRKGVRVEMRLVGGPSWVSIRDGSGRQLFQGLLEEGTSRSFRDDKALKLVLGNAGAVRLTVNGKSLGAPGASGEVSRIEFGPGDPTAA